MCNLCVRDARVRVPDSRQAVGAEMVRPARSADGNHHPRAAGYEDHRAYNATDAQHVEPLLHLRIALSMCYYGGAPFLVPSMILPYVSIMFPVPKPHSDAARGVLGCKSFNNFMVPRHFKMDGLHSIRTLLRAMMFMTKIDLTAAYPTCGISPRYRNYYMFRFRGKFYRYRGQVFGTTSAPRDFTVLLQPVISFLRSFGITLCILLDDIWIGAMLSAQCAQDTQDVLIILSFLGFVIEAKKTQLAPSQRMEWCGTMIDTVLMEFSVQTKKVHDARRNFRLARALSKSGERMTLRRWASVLGVMRSWQHAVFVAMLWSQPLQRLVSRHIRHDKSCWDKLLPLPLPEVMEALDRFLSPGFHKYNGRPVRPLPIDMMTESDASGYGAGIVQTHPLPQTEARWHWDRSELPKHIN